MQDSIAVGIPCYNALPYLVYPLNSLMLQSKSKELTLIFSFDNDPTEQATREWINTLYKPYFKAIEYISGTEQLGPGGNRNRILEWVYSHNIHYITFIDQDDFLWSIDAIESLYEALFDNNGEQIYPASNGILLEELNEGFHSCGNNHQTWVHGKLFDVSFLKKWNICFPVIENEDVGFSNLVTAYCDNKQAYLNKVVYCWRNNKQSLTRSNETYYSQNIIQGFIETKCWCYEHLAHHKGEDAAKTYILSSLPHIYYLSAILDEDIDKKFKDEIKFLIARYVYICQAEKALDKNSVWHDLLYLNLNSSEAKKLSYGRKVFSTYENWIKYYTHYKPFLEAIKPNV